jgi:pimeloyl-ACP methyl ester carboxylesterase
MTARGPIEVADSGQGPVVLVVHGVPGNWRQARTIADDLAGQARVLLVTRPGYGTPLSSGRTPQDQAALYAALLDALSIDRAVVLGISGGGPSSYAFAADYPDRCAGLLLCCALTPHLMTPPQTMVRLAAVPGLWRVAAATARGLTRLTGIKPTDPTTFTVTEQALLAQPAVAEALRRFELQRPASVQGTGLRNDTIQLMAQRQIPWPAGVVVPTVVLHGDADQVVPLEHGRHYASVVPGARLEVLPDYGHALPLFARDRVNDLLRELLRGAPDPPTPGRATAPAAPPP